MTIFCLIFVFQYTLRILTIIDKAMKKMMKWALMFAMTLGAVTLAACSDDDTNDGEETETPVPDPSDKVPTGTIAEALAAAEATEFGLKDVMVVATDGYTILVKDDTGYIAVNSEEVVSPGFKVSVTGTVKKGYKFKLLDKAEVEVTGRNNDFKQPEPTRYDLDIMLWESWFVHPKIEYGKFIGTLLGSEESGYSIEINGNRLVLEIPNPDGLLFRGFSSGSNVELSAYIYEAIEDEATGARVMVLPVEIKQRVLEFAVDVDKEEVSILPEGGEDRIVITIEGGDDVPVVTYEGTDFTVTYDSTPYENEKVQGVFYLVNVSADKNPTEETRTGRLTITVAGQNYYVNLVQHGLIKGEKAFVYFSNHFSSLSETTPFVDGQAYKFFGDDLDINAIFTFGAGTTIKDVLYNTCWYQHPVLSYRSYILFVDGDSMTLKSDKYVLRQIEMWNFETEFVKADNGSTRDVNDLAYKVGIEDYVSNALVWTGAAQEVTFKVEGKTYHEAPTAMRVTYVEK